MHLHEIGSLCSMCITAVGIVILAGALYWGKLRNEGLRWKS